MAGTGGAMNRPPLKLPPLKLPDGRLLEHLRSGPLWRALEPLRIPGLDASMGKHELIETYGRHVENVAADILSPSRPSGPSLTFLPEAIADRAIELIGRNARDAA